MASNPYVNKVEYGGNTIIDLTGDTVEASDVLSGKTFHNASGETETGTCTYDADTSDATAYSGDILYGETAYVNGRKVTGNISSKSSATYTTSTSNQTISSGQYLSGTQTILGVTTSNIIASYIKSGVTVTVGDSSSSTRIKNVTGTYTGSGIPSSPTAGDTCIALSADSTNSSIQGATYQDTGLSVTVPKTGTYRIKRYCWRVSSGSNMGSELVVTSGSTIDEIDTYTTWNGASSRMQYRSYDVSLKAGDIVRLYARGTSSYVVYPIYLALCINWTIS